MEAHFQKNLFKIKIFPPSRPHLIFHPLSTDQDGHILVISFAFLCITVLDIWPRDKWVTIVISITLIFADNHHQCLASRHFIPVQIRFWKAISVMHSTCCYLAGRFPQQGNFMIILSLRFCVKSIFGILKSTKSAVVTHLDFRGSECWFLWIFTFFEGWNLPEPEPISQLLKSHYLISRKISMIVRYVLKKGLKCPHTFAW